MEVKNYYNKCEKQWHRFITFLTYPQMGEDKRRGCV